MKINKTGGTMKKISLSLILLLIFLFPLNLQGKRFFVKLSYGLASGGDLSDMLLTETEYSDYVTMGQEKKTRLGQDIYLEFIYQLNPYLSFSVGNGYTSKALEGKKAHFISPGVTEINFMLSPEFASSIIPTCFSAILSVPVNSFLRINFAGGIGYYYGVFESKSKWKAPYLEGFSTWEHHTWNFKGKGSTVGYHLGAGFDIDLSSKLFVTVDAFYRIIEFNNIKSSGEIGGSQTFSYFRFFIGGELPEFDYRVSRFTLSGYSVRVGLKFKF